MKTIGFTNKDRVYLEWIRSEMFRITDPTPLELELVNNPNLQDENHNGLREQLLLDKLGRRAILDKVPKDINWREVIIEGGDLSDLYVLAIWDWFLDTGKTFKLSAVPSSISSGHGHRVSNFPPAADHKEKLEEMIRSGASNLGGIVMIGQSELGPFTIIDGTHRSSLLVLSNRLHGTRAFLGITPDLSQCVWTPEWAGYQNMLHELNRLVTDGHLW